VSNASTFGLTENARGEVCLTALGRRVADSSQEAAAKVEAFLAVPLYEKIYDNYKGFALPGSAALEKFMRGCPANRPARRGRRLCAQLDKLDFLHRETIDWYGLLALEQSPLTRKVMGANRTSQRKKAPEAMMEAAERFHRRSIQSSWGFWLAFQKLAPQGRRYIALRGEPVVVRRGVICNQTLSVVNPDSEPWTGPAGGSPGQQGKLCAFRNIETQPSCDTFAGRTVEKYRMRRLVRSIV
jgi:hypothetical protein